MATLSVNVLVGDAGDRTLVARLEATGLRVTRVLRTVGVVSGTVDEAAVAQLRKVPGVERVETTRIVRAVVR